MSPDLDPDSEEPELDIGTLLATAFEAKPSNELADRVEARVALRITVAEFLRLVTASPWHWLDGAHDPLDPKPDP